MIQWPYTEPYMNLGGELLCTVEAKTLIGLVFQFLKVHLIHRHERIFFMEIKTFRLLFGLGNISKFLSLNLKIVNHEYYSYQVWQFK